MPFRVGDRVEHGLHLVQLWVRRDERAEEVLVLYPGDGYWRIRPLPPEHLGWSAYGSSFLVGPVEAEARPVVEISAIDFDPATLTFTPRLRGGGTASAEDRQRSTASGSPSTSPSTGRSPAGPSRRCARCTSPRPTPTSPASPLREESAKGWREEPIMGFKAAKATDLWAGRVAPSRHNTSARRTTSSDRFRSD